MTTGSSEWELGRTNRYLGLKNEAEKGRVINERTK
jgi:hypothetical protein